MISSTFLWCRWFLSATPCCFCLLRPRTFLSTTRSLIHICFRRLSAEDSRLISVSYLAGTPASAARALVSSFDSLMRCMIFARADAGMPRR